MILNLNKFPYGKLNKQDGPDGRKYVLPDGKKVESVTSILSKTKDMKHLIAWRKRVGEATAQQITTESAGLGTTMHSHLEAHILGEQRPIGNNYCRLMAERMANTVISEGLKDVDEVWGVETQLHFENLWAGTTDLVGVHQGIPSIIDFKTTNKPKKKEWIDDYFLQLSLYQMAHNWMFNTTINKGVILMVSRECEFQQFIIEGAEFDYYTLEAVKRVDKFYS